MLAVLEARYFPLRKWLFSAMISTDDMKKNTSPVRRYRRVVTEVPSKFKSQIASVDALEAHAELEKAVLHDVHQYFFAVATSIYNFSANGEDDDE